MVVSIILLSLFTVILTMLLSFHYQPEISLFEIKRLAEQSKEFKAKLHFQQIYPGLKNYVNVLAVVFGMALSAIAFGQWGAMGGFIALGAIILAYFASRVIHEIVEEFVLRNLAWFNKYFSWTAFLGKLNFGTYQATVHSRPELAHLVSNIDFMDESERNLILSAIKFPDLKLTDLMTPRARISLIKDSATLSPKIIDELFSTGQKIFPVVHGDLENTLGVVYLDDITNVAKGDQTLQQAAHERPAVISRDSGLMDALETLLSLHLSLLLLEDASGKIVGMLALNTILGTLLNRPIH